MPAARSRSVADRGVPKPRSDAYVGLLSLSLLALTAAMVFAFLNYNGMAEKPKPPAPQVAPKGGGPAGGGGPAVPPAPPAGGPGQPGVPAPPGQQPGGPPPQPGKQPGPQPK